jgi:hypothetical protein
MDASTVDNHTRASVVVRNVFERRTPSGPVHLARHLPEGSFSTYPNRVDLDMVASYHGLGS